MFSARAIRGHKILVVFELELERVFIVERKLIKTLFKILLGVLGIWLSIQIVLTMVRFVWHVMTERLFSLP